MSETTLFITTKLVMGAIAAFLAIILWSRTRDPAWMLIVIGAIASYADILYGVLTDFGLVDPATGRVEGISVLRILFANLPTIFYCIGFIVMITRKRL